MLDGPEHSGIQATGTQGGTPVLSATVGQTGSIHRHDRLDGIGADAESRRHRAVRWLLLGESAESPIHRHSSQLGYYREVPLVLAARRSFLPDCRSWRIGYRHQRSLPERFCFSHCLWRIFVNGAASASFVIEDSRSTRTHLPSYRPTCRKWAAWICAVVQAFRRLALSTRIIRAYDINTDRLPTRTDVLYGWAVLYPELACRVAS